MLLIQEIHVLVYTKELENPPRKLVLARENKDSDWKVIKSYWLDGKNRSYTSVSFLLDRQSRIRLIHDGGEFYRSDENPEANSAFVAIDLKIQELLNENP